MRLYAVKAQALVSGVSEEDFLANEEKQLAVVRAIEVIGEAAKSVPLSIREMAPQVPWRQIVGTRDKLIHHYFGTDLGVVWRVTQEDLSLLIKELEALIPVVESLLTSDD